MTDGWERIIPCQDAHHRDRQLRVYIAEDLSIGLHTPPGDVAQLKPAVISDLSDALAAAALEVAHRGGVWG